MIPAAAFEKTRVFAVPKSIARSFENISEILFQNAMKNPCSSLCASKGLIKGHVTLPLDTVDFYKIIVNART